MAKKNFYAVRVGLVPGIYDKWSDAEVNVKGYRGAVYAGFATRSEAEEYMKTDVVSKSDMSEAQNNATVIKDDVGSGSVAKFEPVFEETSSVDARESYAFVDGSFNPTTRRFGYGGFLYVNGRSYPLMGSSSDPDLAEMRNVAGEIHGSMAAVRKAEELGLSSFKMLYDYKGIEKWAKGEWKANKPGTQAYVAFMNSPVRTVSVEFEHVDAHTGIDGNEKADVMAKYAVGIPLTKSQERLFVEALNQGKRDGVDVIAESGIQCDFSLD